MITPHFEAKAGTLLSVESGDYSAYHIMGFFVVLESFLPAAELDAFVKEANKEETEEWKADWVEEDKFLAHLLKKGFLLEIKRGVLHLDYHSKDAYFTPVGEGE